MGGDEFTILLNGLASDGEAERVAERLQSELSVPFNVDGHDVFTSVSIGIAMGSTRYQLPDDILRDADTAMYRAKQLGKARYEMFHQAMHAVAMDRLGLERDLRRAIERREMFLQYQPIVSLGSSSLRGFEALVRWRHPQRGVIPPADFIPLAEETGIIIQLGRWVLEEACRQMRRWQNLSRRDELLQMSVNLSCKQFLQPDLLEQIQEVLRDTGLDSHSLKLEITESAVMENIETATRTLEQLQALGVELSIDDFGTGYSSLSYLQCFPVNTLKIDRSFVSQITECEGTAEIVRTIMHLGQTLGMDVIAEGVETEMQSTQLKSLGCEFAQGYYFSQPMDRSAAEALFLKHYPETGNQPDVVNPINSLLGALTVAQ